MIVSWKTTNKKEDINAVLLRMEQQILPHVPELVKQKAQIVNNCLVITEEWNINNIEQAKQEFPHLFWGYNDLPMEFTDEHLDLSDLKPGQSYFNNKLHY